jgi:hypothetical protein
MGVNYVNYYEIVGKIAQILHQEGQNETTGYAINLSSGSKMVAIALMDIYRIWGKHMKMVYIYSLDYDPLRDGPVHKGMMYNAKIPKFEFEIPTQDLVKSLQILASLRLQQNNNNYIKYVNQNQWQEALIQKKLIQRATIYNTDRTQESAESNILRKKFRKPAEEFGFITIKEKGRQNHIYLTSKGEAILEFYHLYFLN